MREGGRELVGVRGVREVRGGRNLSHKTSEFASLNNLHVLWKCFESFVQSEESFIFAMGFSVLENE